MPTFDVKWRDGEGENTVAFPNQPRSPSKEYKDFEKDSEPTTINQGYPNHYQKSSSGRLAPPQFHEDGSDISRHKNEANLNKKPDDAGLLSTPPQYPNRERRIENERGAGGFRLASRNCSGHENDIADDDDESTATPEVFPGAVHVGGTQNAIEKDFFIYKQNTRISSTLGTINVLDAELAPSRATTLTTLVTAAAVSVERIKNELNANFMRGMCGGFVLIAIIVGFVVPITKKQAPTAAPTPQSDYDYVIDLVTPMSGNKIFDKGTPQYEAFHWLIYDDPAMLAFKEVDTSIVTERYIAAVGYFSLGGPWWLNQLDFLSNSSVCNWTDGSGNGILCYNTPLVKAYQVFSNNVSGTMPPELAYFETMEAFGFVNGNVSGTLPPEYGRSRSLRYFQISEQAVTGTIPKEYAALTQLDTINFANLSLTGTIPEGWFDSSVTITYLDLSINRLEGTIPPVNPHSILWFYSVEQNNLTGTIPSSLYMQPNLKDLILSSNRFIGTIDPQIQALGKLTTLQVENNMLTGSIPWTFGALDTLKEMMLNSNLLTGTIPSQLGNMKSLTKLDISSNELMGTIPSELAGLDLEYLNFASNGLTGTVPSSFAAVSALYQFWIQNTSITDGLEYAFCNRTLQTSISADCGGNSPDIPCSCCNMCCDNKGENCVLDLPGVCAISITAFEADEERGGTKCTCDREGSYLSCSDTACQTCSVDNSVCALSTDYGYTFNETTGEIVSFHATLQYVKGRNESIRFSQDPNSQFCELEVDGELCRVCRVVGCVSTQLGMGTDCRNIGASTKITTCNDYTEDLGKFQGIMWIDPSRRDGCAPMIQISDGI